MKEQDVKHTRRIKKLATICTVGALILAVSTYAWFIGMKTVNITTFDVEIAAIDQLSLSIDGDEWLDTININQANYKTDSYTNNTNIWPEKGLVPISTVGKIDASASRLIMYEKGSFTVVPGGYRVMASRIPNAGLVEKEGYVAFDLFIMNLSGNEYYPEMNVLNEEAIYLTIDSKVTVPTTGENPGVANTGIENSVRVAFAQIGRVKATVRNDANGKDTITGITCTSNGTVTGICTDRDAQIWEPNDTAHVLNARTWYERSCMKRTGTLVTADTSYSGNCKTVADGTAYRTYAISGVIGYGDNVNTYDGEDYNEYTASVADTATEGKLMSYDYFTDTEKNLAGTKRPTFINLAPNSITKVRVYVYIEGQDVDNYDFASLGKKISVKFGFTKERYFGEDINYSNSGTANLPSDVIKAEHQD